MASEDDRNRKCFTFIWKIENASYYSEKLESPLFTVDEVHESNWKLELFPFHDCHNVGIFLQRHADNKNQETVKIDCDIAFLSSNGEVLLLEKRNAGIGKNGYVGSSKVISRNDLFSERRSMFLPQDTLTTRCRIWKSVDEMSKDMQCLARTRILIEKRSFLWNIEKFSTLNHKDKKTYVIKSLRNGKNAMFLELFLSGGLFSDETIRFKFIPDYNVVKICTFQLSIVDASKNTVKCFQDEFSYHDVYGSKVYTLFCTKSELMKKKSRYLLGDVLSLECKCTLSFETKPEEIEKVDSDSIVKVERNSSVGAESEISAATCILLDDLKSMLNNSHVSDVKLKTKNEIYPAHKCILSARSPVFKAMFSNDMREKIKKCVDIEDLSDDTVLRMLRYIYSSEVEELEWISAIQLYQAADKYQILSLRDICSSFLKCNLSVNNACDALLLGDMHHDEDLKSFVQNFILRHGKDIVNSEEWEHLASTYGKLVFDTMRLKFNE